VKFSTNYIARQKPHIYKTAQETLIVGTASTNYQKLLKKLLNTPVYYLGLPGVSRYQKGKTNLDFTKARDSEWQWHQLDHIQVCTLLQRDNHDSTAPLSFLQAGCPSCHPTNSVIVETAGTNYQKLQKKLLVKTKFSVQHKATFSHGGQLTMSW